MRLFWIGLALTACSGDDPPESPPESPPLAPTGETGEPPGPAEGDRGDALGPRFASGTRLVARSVGASDSDDRVFVNFHDTDLDVPCAFTLASDEVLRCLPVTALQLGTAYLDANCQQPVNAYPCDAPLYDRLAVSRELDDECDPDGFVVEVREVAIVEPVDGVFTNATGSCEPWPGDPPVVGQVGALVDPATFVAGTVEERVTRQGFGVREIVADDGAQRHLDLFTEADGDCAMRYLADLGPRCVPANVAILGAGPEVDWWFGDAQCATTPLAYRAANPCDEAPRVAIEFADFEGPVLHRLGPAWSEPIAYDDRTDTCDETTVSETPWTLYPVTGPGTDQTLPPLTLEVETGSPVGFTTFVDGFGLELAPGFAEGRLGSGAGGPFQRPDGTPCSPFLTEDGAARCVGAEVAILDQSSVRYFTDASCTNEVLSYFGDPQPTAVGFVDDRACGGLGSALPVLQDVRDLEGPYEGAELYFREPGVEGCTVTERSPGTVYSLIADSILQTLPALTVE